MSKPPCKLIRVPTLVAALCVLAIASAVHASDALEKVVASYLEIHNQLAADKIEGIKAPASAIATAATGMGETGKDIVTAAKAVGAAADIKAAREAFGTLSNAVIAAAKAESWQGLDDVKVAFCPMANRSWLQKADTIRNPYYGTQMLTCGSFTDPRLEVR